MDTVLGQRGGEGVEEGLGGGRADLGGDQGEGLVGAGADRGVQPRGGVAAIHHAARAAAPFIPDAGAAALLADTGLILAPDLDCGLGMGARDRVQGGGEAPFLKRSRAAGSACGWLGRVFCQDRPRDFTSRRMPPSR